MLKILFVDENSVGAEIGLEKGDSILAFDGEEAVDVLDYEYYEGQETFSITVLTKDGEKVDVDIEKDIDETLGLTFDESAYLKSRACRNKCIFCFVDQLPKGMRKSLYFKDDDWRMSFAAGNYVTFTNLTEKEIQRILSKKFSPLYVSVHCSDDNVRRAMLQNKTAQDIMPLLKRFADAGITMHTQTVLCPGVNDGEVLQKTMDDLYALYPYVNTLAVVPVGLTKVRDGLTQVKPLGEEDAKRVLEMTDRFAQKCKKENGCRFVYCSDEFYLKAKKDFPTYGEYGSFSQIEDGVGLITKFKKEFDDAVKNFSAAKEGSFTLVTGVSAYPFIKNLADELKEKFGVKCQVIRVENEFFGKSVTVSGLLTARDILAALSKTEVGDTVLLPRVLLREIKDVFLDDVTLDEFKKAVGRKVETVENDGADFCRKMLKGEKDV